MATGRPRGPWHSTACVLALWSLAMVAQAFDLAGYRRIAASERARGIELGREALAQGVFAEDPRNRLRLLWYMGGAALGAPDDAALAEVASELEALQARGVDGAGSLAGFLRGGRRLGLGDTGNGLVEILTAANAVPADDDELRSIAAAELCRAYAGGDAPERGLPHCRRHRALVELHGDVAARARASYLEASVLSTAGQRELAIPQWRRSLALFREAGLDALAGRAAGSLAWDLNASGAHAEALEMAGLAVREAQRAGNPISVCIARGQEARALLGLARHAAAQDAIDAAKACLAGLDSPSTLRDLLLVERDLLQQQGAVAARIAMLETQIARLSGEAVAPEQAQAIDSLEQRYLQREQGLRIRELEQENLRKELEIESARQALEAQRQAAQQQRLAMAGWAVAAGVLLVVLLATALVLRTQSRLARTLREHAYRDGLTRLPNRRALVERLQGLLAEGQGRSHALLLVDLDHFKAINDTHGHPVGDRVLAEVAACLARHEPPGGMIARLGGEEFVVLQPDCDEARADAAARALREAIAGMEVLLNDGTRVQVTASIGVAMSDRAEGDQSRWIGGADAALYRAKAAGRDRVELAWA